MSAPIVAPYGEWKSSITADMIVGETVGLGQICCDGEDIYWTELRPSEKEIRKGATQRPVATS